MLKKCICLLWAICMVMGTAGVAKADTKTGSVRIVPQWCGQAVKEGTVVISRVGEKTEDGYFLTDGLANWKIEESELRAGDWMTWLVPKKMEQEMISTVQEGRGAVFTQLSEGVYLVKQLERDLQGASFKPFFLTIPEGENWDVYRAPKVISHGESPKTGDHPAPIIGAMGIGLSVAALMVLVDGRKK